MACPIEQKDFAYVLENGCVTEPKSMVTQYQSVGWLESFTGENIGQENRGIRVLARNNPACRQIVDDDEHDRERRDGLDIGMEPTKECLVILCSSSPDFQQSEFWLELRTIVLKILLVDLHRA